MDINQFDNFCLELNEFCKNNQSQEKENVSDEKAFEALCYVSLISLKQQGDYLLFLSSINLLNAYIKQKDSKISYNFKNNIGIFLDNLIINTNINELSFGYDKTDKKCLIFDFNNIQFSFHHISTSKCANNIDIPINKVWDGIRKQICSVSLFDLCKENKILFSNKTYRGKDLTLKVDRFLENYKKGLCDFNIKF